MIKSITELDISPMTSNAVEIQNLLLELCGVDNGLQAPEKTGGKDQSNSRVERLFGKIKKLPKKSSFLENFGVGPLSLDPISDKLEERKFDKEVDKDEKQ